MEKRAEALEESLSRQAKAFTRRVCFTLFYFRGDARFRRDYVFISQLELAHGVLFFAVVEFLKSQNSLTRRSVYLVEEFEFQYGSG